MPMSSCGLPPRLGLAMGVGDANEECVSFHLQVHGRADDRA
jgi:hypothetical protein